MARISLVVFARVLGLFVLAVLSLVPRSGPATASVLAAAQARERVAYVSVVDEKTLQPIDKVTADTITIREDGVQREVLSVSPATSEMPVALVLDNSQAAAPTIPDLRQAVSGFVKTLDGLGPIGIFTIADRPTMVQAYTTSQQELLDAAGRLFQTPSSGATLLDSIADVARGLERRESERAAIVVVTGENTEFSNLHYSNVLERLRDSGAMLYAVVLLNPQASITDEESRNRAVVLDRGPRESGGLRSDVLTSMSFDERLATIGRMLKSQHRVVYARPEALIQPEKFEVSATTPGLQAYGAPARGQEER